MINLKIYHQIIERKRKHAIELQDVPFFQIEKDGCIAYLLGTDHGYDLSTLPEFVLERIKECNQLFTENATPSTEEFSAFLQSMRVREVSQVIWEGILSQDQISTLRRIAYALFEGFACGVDMPFDLLELEPSFLIYSIESLMEAVIEQVQLKLNCSNCSSEAMAIGSPMDLELQELFCSEELALEPYGLGALGVSEIDDGVIHKLKKCILPFFNKYEHFENFSVKERSEFQTLVLQLISESKRGKQSYHGDINDFTTAVDLDSEIKNGELNIAIRTLLQFNTIETTIKRYNKPLYAAGDDHSKGSLGLISMLRLKGYTISKITPDGPKPINYLYNIYCQSYAAIRRNILGGSKESHPNAFILRHANP